MNWMKAQALVERILKEVPGITATVEHDTCLSWDRTSYYIDVHKRDVLRLCIRSVEQWEQRRQLFKEKEHFDKVWRSQAILRGLTIQLNQIVEGNVGTSLEHIQWFIDTVNALIMQASGEREEQLGAIKQEMMNAQETLRDEKTREEFYLIAPKVLQLMRETLI